MNETRFIKLFSVGSRAVRVPAEFRFEGDEIYATRDEATGDVVLSRHPGKKVWSDFFAALRSVEVLEDFMAERPMNVVSAERGVFDEKVEAAAPKQGRRR